MSGQDCCTSPPAVRGSGVYRPSPRIPKTANHFMPLQNSGHVKMQSEFWLFV